MTANALALIRDLLSIINGMPADKPARINRLTPKAINIKTVNSTPVRPWNINRATTHNVAARTRFEYAIARWREMRSKIVPTKGPIMEYGRRTTAKASAAFKAFAWRSGEKSTKEASAL